MGATTVLGKSLVDSLYGLTDSTEVNSEIMKVIGNYITSNVKLNVIFSGALILYPFTPISGVSDVVSIDGSLTENASISFPDPGSLDSSIMWTTWMMSIYTGIRLALVSNGTLVIPTGSLPALTLMITPSFSQSDLKSAFEDYTNNNDSSSSSFDPQGVVMDAISNGITGDMKLGYLPTFPATYASTYIGTATVSSIIAP